MARYREAVCRLCRREGQKLYLKGERCSSEKCAFTARQSKQNGQLSSVAPGQHGSRRRKLSEYGLQLREKQKTKRCYGILEGQFYKYFLMAAKTKGKTGEVLLRILETRLDNVVYRLGFGASRAEARQLVVHSHFLVNGKKVNIPSYLVKQGDVVQIKEKSLESEKFKSVIDFTSSRIAPKWLECDKNAHVGKVVGLPDRQDIDIEIEEHLIVELYSK